MLRAKHILFNLTLAIVGFYFLFLGLSQAKSFLAPVLTAIVLALVILPLAEKLETFLKRSYSSLVSTFVLFLVSLCFMALFSFQAESFIEDWPAMRETMQPKVEQLKSYLIDNTPVKESDLGGEGDNVPFINLGSEQAQRAVSVFNETMAFLGTYLLTFIYIFFLLNYRKRFKEFLLRLFPKEREAEIKEIISDSANVVQQYLVGKLILIGLLAILYSVGLGLSGVSNFILLSIIAALLTLIPYLGNIIGFLMVLSFAYLTTGEIGILIGITITFLASQFIESYILQPYIVGDKVDLHPFFVILVVVIGNAVWGVIGMILSIPVMAILTVIFIHVPPLHPLGFLFSNKSV